MAHMFPENGPSISTTSEGERILYPVLREGLGDEYWVFHHVRWFPLEGRRHQTLRECDFIVAHPLHGILILEVKSGGARRHNRTRARLAREAVGQAASLKPLLSRHLWNSPLTKHFAGTVRVGHGVWFPEVTWHQGAGFQSGSLDGLVLDRSDVEQPTRAIARLYCQLAKQEPIRGCSLSDEDMQALADALGSSNLHLQSTLLNRSAKEDQRFAQLRDQQFKVLDMLAQQSRVAIRGAAGTGKTVLGL